MEKDCSIDGLGSNFSVQKMNQNKEDDLRLSFRNPSNVDSVWLNNSGSNKVSKDGSECSTGCLSGEEKLSLLRQQEIVSPNEMELKNPLIMELLEKQEHLEETCSNSIQADLDVKDKICDKDVTESNKLWSDETLRFDGSERFFNVTLRAETNTVDVMHQVEISESKSILSIPTNQINEVNNYASLASTKSNGTVECFGWKLTRHETNPHGEVVVDQNETEDIQASSELIASTFSGCSTGVASAGIAYQSCSDLSPASASTKSVYVDAGLPKDLSILITCGNASFGQGELDAFSILASSSIISPEQLSKDECALLNASETHRLKPHQAMDSGCDQALNSDELEPSVKVPSKTLLKQLKPYREIDVSVLGSNFRNTQAAENYVTDTKVEDEYDLKLPSVLSVPSGAKFQYALIKTDFSEEFDIIPNDSENDFKLSQNATALVSQRSLLTPLAEGSRNSIEMEHEGDLGKGHGEENVCLKAKEFNETVMLSVKSLNTNVGQNNIDCKVKVYDSTLIPVMGDVASNVDNVECASSATSYRTQNRTNYVSKNATIGDYNAESTCDDLAIDECSLIPVSIDSGVAKVCIKNLAGCTELWTSARQSQSQVDKIASVSDRNSEVIPSPSEMLDIVISHCVNADRLASTEWVGSREAQVDELNETAGDNWSRLSIPESNVSEHLRGFDLPVAKKIQCSDEVYSNLAAQRSAKDVEFVKMSCTEVERAIVSTESSSTFQCFDCLNTVEEQQCQTIENCQKAALEKLERMEERGGSSSETRTQEQNCSAVKTKHQVQRIGLLCAEESADGNSEISGEDEPQNRSKSCEEETNVNHAELLSSDKGTKLGEPTETCSFSESDIKNIPTSNMPLATTDDFSWQHVAEEESNKETDVTCNVMVRSSTCSIKSGNTNDNEASVTKTGDTLELATGITQCDDEAVKNHCSIDISEKKHIVFSEPQHPQVSSEHGLVSQYGNQNLLHRETGGVKAATDDISADTYASVLCWQNEDVKLTDFEFIQQRQEGNIDFETASYNEIHAVDHSNMVKSLCDLAVHSKLSKSVLDLDQNVTLVKRANATAEQSCAEQVSRSTNMRAELVSSTLDEVSLTRTDETDSEIFINIDIEKNHSKKSIVQESHHQNDEFLSELGCGNNRFREVLDKSTKDSVFYHVVPMCDTSTSVNSAETSGQFAIVGSSRSIYHSSVVEKRKRYDSYDELVNDATASSSMSADVRFQVEPLSDKFVKGVVRTDQSLDDCATRFENESCLYEEDHTCAKRILLDQESGSLDKKTLDREEEFTTNNINQSTTNAQVISSKALGTAYRWRSASSLNAAADGVASNGAENEAESSGCTVLTSLKTGLRPMRLGLSRRQRTTSLHPYLKTLP